jgi:hypothetical protein
MSNVSVWLGPPAIHNRMHCRFLDGDGPNCSARAGSHPEALMPSQPNPDALRKSRLDDPQSLNPCFIAFDMGNPPLVGAERPRSCPFRR